MTRTTLGALVDAGVLALGDGYRTKASEYDDAGIPILRVADVLEGALSPSYKDRVSLARLPQIGAKQSRAGDVIVTTKGTVGRVALIPDALPSHVYSPQLCYLRVLEPSQVDQRWLYSWARSPQFQRQTGSVKDQTDMAPYVSLGDLRRFRIEVPPLDEQRRIAEVLGALDDLIDTNERIAAALWSTIEAAFERMQRTADEQRALGEVIELKYGKALPSDSRRPGDVPVVSSAGITGAHDTALVEGPGVVIGRKGSVGSVTWVDSAFYPIDTAFYVQVDRVPMSWAYFLLKSLPLDSMNTDSAVPGLNRANALALRIDTPDLGALREFDLLASELIHGARSLRSENTHLRRTRDELLPLLMSGAVRVKPEGVAA